MFRVLDLESGETGYLIEDNGWKFEHADLDPDYVLMPSFFNAHTHIGDSFMEAPRISLERLVGPNGYKFKKLHETDERTILRGMKKAIDLIKRTSSTSLEFREGGIDGYRLYMKADPERILTALSRPLNLEEAEMLAELSGGFNFSSTRDHSFSFLEECRDIARKRKLIFAIHAGEVNEKDVDAALNLEPDFLIHMNRADGKQLRRAMDMEIYIVSCLRANAFFGVFNLKNYRILSEYERWLIGTDNAMIATPSMVDELKFGSCFLECESLFRAGTGNPFFDSHMLVRYDKIIDPEKITCSVIRRIESCDIKLILRENISRG